jgi:hypothetical protein
MHHVGLIIVRYDISAKFDLTTKGNKFGAVRIKLLVNIYFLNFNTRTVDLLLFCAMTNKCKLSHNLSHCYMFRHNRVILREILINALPSYTIISNAVVGNIVTSSLRMTQ